jgi:raffinose/stachyose/melibiose transport system permease protein
MEIVRFFKPGAGFTLNNYPMIPVLVVILWMYTGFYMIIFLANLQRIDISIIEAARIDGAREGQVLSRIILPALFGVIITCTILAISGSLKVFDLIYVMTAGGPANKTRVLSLYMYLSAFQGAPNYPLANAISTIMVLISFALIIITRQAERIFGEKG